MTDLLAPSRSRATPDRPRDTLVEVTSLVFLLAVGPLLPGAGPTNALFWHVVLFATVMTVLPRSGTAQWQGVVLCLAIVLAPVTFALDALSLRVFSLWLLLAATMRDQSGLSTRRFTAQITALIAALVLTAPVGVILALSFCLTLIISRPLITGAKAHDILLTILLAAAVLTSVGLLAHSLVGAGPFGLWAGAFGPPDPRRALIHSALAPGPGLLAFWPLLVMVRASRPDGLLWLAATGIFALMSGFFGAADTPLLAIALAGGIAIRLSTREDMLLITAAGGAWGALSGLFVLLV